MMGGVSLGLNVVYVDLLLGDAALGPLWLGGPGVGTPTYTGCDSWYDTDIEGNFCGDYYPEESDYDWRVDYAVNVGVVSPLGLPLGDSGLFPLGYVGRAYTKDDEAVTQYGFGLVWGATNGDRGGGRVRGDGVRATVALAPGGTSWSLGWVLDFD